MQEFLAEVEDGCWETLARRRVQHFGYKFEYWVRRQCLMQIQVPSLIHAPHIIRHAQSEAIKKSKRQLTQRVVQARNVDVSKPIRPLPPAAQRLLQRLEQLLEQLLGVQFDQLTVNEYQPGVGLSSHVDTHSAFTGASPSSAPCCVFIHINIHEGCCFT